MNIAQMTVGLVFASAVARGRNTAAQISGTVKDSHGLTVPDAEVKGAGVDPNERRPRGETALMFPARSGDLASLKVLLDHKAESMQGNPCAARQH